MDYDRHVARIDDRLKEFSKYFSLKFDGNFEKFTRKNRLSQRQITFIKDVSQVLEDLYPSRWDIHFGITAKWKTHINTYGSNHAREFQLFDGIELEKIYLVIHWPEVTVKNGKHQEIVIKDLYTRIPVKMGMGDIFYFEQIQGTRTTFSPAEFKKGYLHSHLNSRRLDNADQRCIFTTFCTGEGDINMITQALSSTDKPDMDMIKLLLLHVKEFIQWESLMGGPFIRMENVVECDMDIINPNPNDYPFYFDNFKSNLKRSKSLNIDWKHENGRWVIVDNEKFEEMLRINMKSNTESAMWLFKTEQGEYYKPSTIRRDIFEGATEFVPFRNQKQFFKVEGTFRQAGATAPKYLHPKIKQYVKQQLEFQANSSKVRQAQLSK